MKSIVKIAIALVVMAGVSPNVYAAAACPPGQALRKLGTAQTANGVYSSAGEDVRAVSVQCTSSACVAGLYDTATNGAQAVANLVVEVGAAASGNILFPTGGFLEAPLQFRTGVSTVLSNVAAITILGCQVE